MTGFLTGWISAVISFGVQLCVRDFDPAICADVILMKSDLWHPGLWSIYQNPSLSLDVLLDSNLTYNDHIGSTVSICMSCLGQINRVKHSIDRNTLTIVINALVLSKLYCWYVLSKLYCC